MHSWWVLLCHYKSHCEMMQLGQAGQTLPRLGDPALKRHHMPSTPAASGAPGWGTAKTFLLIAWEQRTQAKPAGKRVSTMSSWAQAVAGCGHKRAREITTACSCQDSQGEDNGEADAQHVDTRDCFYSLQ